MILPTIDFPTPTPDRQPSTMEFVSYSRIQHALPDGRPDFSAPDNSFVVETGQWFLRTDTDDVPANGDGSRHVHVPEFSAKEFVRYDSLGPASKPLLARFKEVDFGDAPLARAIERGRSLSGALDFDLPKGQRILYFEIRHIAQRVEIHTDGGHRLVRSIKETHWETGADGWYPGKRFVPSLRSAMPPKSMLPVQAGPPILKYGPVVWPKGDDF